jgi:hypothetical protein
MQMLQTIVYEDPIPTRLLLNHHSTSSCGTCMEIRFAAPSLLRGFEQRLGILVLAIQLFPLRPSYVPGVRARALENVEAMAQTQTRRVDSFSRQQEAQAYVVDSQPGLCS